LAVITCAPISPVFDLISGESDALAMPNNSNSKMGYRSLIVLYILFPWL
jgi:hypothetical protein